MTTTVRTEITTTENLTLSEAQELWQQRCNSYHHGLGSSFKSRGTNYRGDAVRAWTDHHQLIKWRSDSSLHWKNERHLRSAPSGDPFLLVCNSGRFGIEQNGQQRVLLPGDAGIFTMGRPLVFNQIERSSAMILSSDQLPVETSRISGAEPPFQVDFRTGLGRIAQVMMTTLAEQAPSLTPDQFDAVATQASDLVAMALRGEEIAPNSRLADIAAAAQRYVRLHAGDPTLRGETLAAELGWSLRQLQLALQTVGTTPRRLIKETRLSQARDLLTDPRTASMPVSEVARRTGFISASTFSVAFRDRYGHPPRMLRAAHTGTARR